ncbi:MAG: NAD(P)H-dependent oxidoreductase [Proteobacteria bacterium]|nr:NAD(P)H-dependent oxidoreductase [Pseudomonadota bacterium]
MTTLYRILGIAGSLRAKSFNKSLLLAAKKSAPASLAIDIFDLAGVPLLDQDVEAKGYPEAVAKLQAAAGAADGVLIATPEYNSGIPGVLKNALDWMSRPPHKSTSAGKPVAVIGTSPGMGGTLRVQIVMRPVLAGMGMLQLAGPDTAVPGAGQAFDAEGNLVDERARAALAKTLDAFAAWIAQLKAKA